MAIEMKEIVAARERARDEASGAEQPKKVTMTVGKMACVVLESDVSEYEKYGYKRVGDFPVAQDVAKKLWPQNFVTAKGAA